MNDTKIIKKLKKMIVETSFKAREGHIPSAFSILDILWVLYNQILSIDPKKPRAPERDYFILSKGHSSLGLYTVLAEKGFFSFSEFEKFCTYGGVLGGHPDRNKVPGVEASTGSLGHGLPMAVGIALGLKIKKSDKRVFVLIGDGEANEGTIWESALVSAHHSLDNLTCIVDHNHSTDRAVDMGNILKKFMAFGWVGQEIDGHNHKDIATSLLRKNTAPTIIVANTIKGKGVKIFENNPAWHHKTPNNEELVAILKELS